MDEMLYHTIRQISVDTKIVMTSLQLYKYLLRQCERLPPDACKHYKFAIKQVIYSLELGRMISCNVDYFKQ